MAQPGIIVYGAMWCPDCVRAKRFLGEQLVRFRWVDIESDARARAYVEQVNHGKRIIPTIVFEDGTILVEPTNAQLADKLGLQSRAKMSYYDVIIVGAGPAGLTAAMYLSREGMKTLVVERSSPGGQAGVTSRMENFPGFPEGLTGQEFSERIVRQARQFGAELLQAQQVMRLETRDNHRIAHFESGSANNSSAILVATGATYRRLYAPGEEDYVGAGIHFCATCDGPFYRGSDHLVVIGGGNTAVEESIFLTQFTERVTLLVRGDQLSASKLAQDQLAAAPAVQVRFNTVVSDFQGDDRLRSVRIRNIKSGVSETLRPAGVFVLIGSTPNTTLVKGMVTLDPDGYILTGRDLMDMGQANALNGSAPQRRIPHAMETSVRGIFAAGDVRAGSTKQVAAAVGEGASAALAIREYLRGK